MTNNTRKSIDLLPAFFRTEKNNKFLSSTLDQLISPPTLSRIDAFVGSTDTPNYRTGDQYLSETNPLRAKYQLEPALVVRTLSQEIKKAFALDDLLNQVTTHGGQVSDTSRILNPEFYSYDPNIDWDKFVNFREYYWMPTGPAAVQITGNQQSSIVEYSVTDADDGKQFVFGGLTTTAELVLYRGYTYVFNVESVHNFYIKYTNIVGSADQYTKNITGNGTKSGQVVVTIDWSTPERLFYTSNDEQLSTGMILVKESNLNSLINVDDEIIGRVNYTSASGIKFINGLKVRFDGTVFPEEYRDSDFIVEGVGRSITLIKFSSLDTPDSVADIYNATFDGTNFDDFPFDNFKNTPIVPEYVTINRASRDLNPWSRYNRWVHSDVLRTASAANNTLLTFPVTYRATRPIVEFAANMQLFNFGTSSIATVDLVDNITTNAFQTVEGQNGFYLDSILLEEGFRVIFNGDTDPLIRTKIFRVTFVNVRGTSRINLIEEPDTIIVGSSVLVKKGSEYSGTSWHYDGSVWLYSQQRATRNQAPLFDLFDSNGNSYADINYYATSFKGNKVFGYGIGSGTTDTVLGFPLLYRNVGVEGTFLFKNYFATEDFISIDQSTTTILTTAGTYFKVDGQLLNVWVPAADYSTSELDVPLNTTNNPMNLPISEFTLTELSDHVSSMTKRDPQFSGTFPGLSNIKDLPNIGKYGTKLISNLTPMSFAHHFITDQENSIIAATRLVGEHYYQFKFNLLKAISEIGQNVSPAAALDIAIASLNQNKTTTFPYYHSDMIAFGDGAVVRDYKVTDSRNTKYSLPSEYTEVTLNSHCILIYLNNQQLIKGIDYQFDAYDANVEILVPLERGDSVLVKDYFTTDGNFVPPTPTKLGLYPKFEPKIFLDDTVAGEPANMIQGHDGSLTLAFGDYRDAVLLEFEKRIFNNIKVEYRNEVLDINSVMPGAFRTAEYTYGETFNPVYRDFARWKSSYNVEVEKNLLFDVDNHKTYNYSSIVNESGVNLPGSWRAIFKLYFDTDRPNTCPWEMLGFSMKPTWWESYYGPAPYTAGNTMLWDDIEKGNIADGDRKGIDATYARPGLYSILPVDDNGNIVNIRDWGLIGEQGALVNADVNWNYGDCGPAENSWRRSSYWPFAVQIIMAVLKPAAYASLMFDTSRLVKNAIGHYVYSEDNLFISPARVMLPYQVVNGSTVLTSGYSVFVIEAGLIKNQDYIDQLSVELKNSDFNLMNKVGGFISKDKLEVVIDSVNPNSINPGILLPTEDYTIHFNVSSPVETIAISGVIVQKLNGEYIVRGYDKIDPYFEVLVPVHQKTDSSIVVGAKSEDYIAWSINVFYSVGQVISYQNNFYRVASNHNSGSSFNSQFYRALNQLPTVGGTTILYPSLFENDTVKVPYGTVFSSIQDVADFLTGYGKQLELRGFLFDEYNAELGQLLDWKFTIKEFLYWTTQNWADNSVIAVSPFSNRLKLQLTNSVVDNIFNGFYDYTLLKADGYAFPTKGFSISRTDGACTITTTDVTEGIFFARLRLVQKEHAIIFNNLSRFNDVIYDTETGYRQRRVRLIGFKTAEWNGDFYSPGFVYDAAKVQTWESYADYIAGDVVEYAGKYYSLDRNLTGKESFEFADWNLLGSKPVAQLIPNFEYKINQFEDFYSLDIDNFDISQQQLAQHLVGYSSRVYLDNIFLNPIAQYKFYQGFIKEKGTRNALDKLARASVHNLQGKISFNEEWAFRIGAFGAYSSETEIEFALSENKFVDNSQLITFVNERPVIEYDATVYITPSNLEITPPDYNVANTFKTVPTTFNDNLLIMPVAGYVRLDDVEFAIKTKDDLYSFEAGKTVNIGDTFWIGFDDNEDWGVYRYARLPAAIIGASAYIFGESISFETDRYHGLKVGDIIAVTRFESSLNGIYKIKHVPQLNELVVSTVAELPASTNDSGILFKFVTSRFDKFDDLVNAEFVADIVVGKNVWVDTDVNDKWNVYKKINNYVPNRFTNRISVDAPYFGKKIISKENSNLVIVSSPDYDDGTGAGAVFVYTNTDSVMKLLTLYKVNKQNNELYNNTTGATAHFSHAIDFDAADRLIVAGAPFASNVKSDPGGTTRFVEESNSAGTYIGEGLVIISGINAAGNAEVRYAVLACQEPQNNIQFGHSVFVGSTSTNKILLVGAPGHAPDPYLGATGAVFSYSLAYSISFDGLNIEVNTTATSQIILPIPSTVGDGARFGASMTGDLVGKRIAVSAPGASNGGGQVCIFTSTDVLNYTHIQTIEWDDLNTSDNEQLTTTSSFGANIDMDDSGTWLFISAPTYNDDILQDGRVLIYKWNGSQYVFSQLLTNPSSSLGLQFGHGLESDTTGQILGITSLGPVYYSGISFDEGETTFDSAATKFGQQVQDAGTAYTYNRYEDKFIFSAELFDSYVSEGSKYGTSIAVTRDTIYVGAPLHITTGTIRAGEIYAWSAIDPDSNGWSVFRQQEDLVDTSLVNQVKTIDTFTDQVRDYLEVYDPAKGKIPQIADQEIRYKTVFDPAVYNTGTSTTIVIDSQIKWGKAHVGELWWDLSSLKYMWYEQGEVEYRKNAWGAVFPGCTVDVCEWVASEYPPDQWAEVADTPTGLAMNMSGQPKYLSDLAYVVDEQYSPSTDTYTNIYYYWVKNSVIVPERQGRSVSAYEVSTLISDPSLAGSKYIQILSGDSASVTNVKGSLINDRITLNIQLDAVVNKNNKHTEWLLIEEGEAHSLPNTLLEKKLIDSLLGRDSLGNPVPDPALSERQRYGIGVRPRQTMFRNRLAALRNLVGYVNSVFAENLITDFYSLKTLNQKDSIDLILTSEYDIIVEDLDKRNTIYFGNFAQGAITCSTTNGRITSTQIVSSGYGYGTNEAATYDDANNILTWKGPAVSIYNDNNGGRLESEVDSEGRIVKVIIANAGNGYVDAPEINVRPYTVIVQTDSDARGRWTKYALADNAWVKIQTQSFDTTLYWDLVNWVSPDYNPYQSLAATVDQSYQLSSISLSANDYVKVNNGGAGRFLILKKIASGAVGTYNTDYDVMVSEKGTIKINDSIWSNANSQFGFDQVSPYDDTFFDQAPDKELETIIAALKNDIFVGNLKVCWNKFFFAAIKYVLTEQKVIDWAFKTSFINVHNLAGLLTQRSVYKFQDTQWYEDYLKEIKPYHTHVRNYNLTYGVLEDSNSFTTDFDLPVVFDSTSGEYKSLAIDDPMMQQYPYKGWFDNHTLYLDSIAISDGGDGYTEVPEVRIVAASGDTVTRTAVATALIGSGKVIGFEITDKGEGYLSNPTILLLGGGGVGLTPAKVSPIMVNGKVRVNKVGIKFDRISKAREIGDKQVDESFVADGVQYEYILSWPASLDKSLVEVTADGIFVTPSSYTLEDYTATYNGYSKVYTKLVSTIQYDKDTVIDISYTKSLKIYAAVDRIQDYYDPIAGMPGKDSSDSYGQLMRGIDYPGTQIVTQEFERDFSWDTVPFNSILWDPVSSQTVDLDTTYDGGTITTSTPYIQGHWTSISSVSTSTPWVDGKWTASRSLALGIRPEDIILDGDQFISPLRTHGPEELVPGHVSDTLGINVFTRKTAGSAMIYTTSQTAQANSRTTIQLSIQIPGNGSLYVTYNNALLRGGQDYTLDYETNILTVYARAVDGFISVSYMDIGGAGFLSLDATTSEGSTVAALIGSCAYADVKSLYVAVNGLHVPVYDPTSPQLVHYVLSEDEPGVSSRAKVTVHGLGIAYPNTIVAAFFNQRNKAFSEVREQIELNITPSTRLITLIQPPGNLGAASANSIVEVNGARIIPPNTTYYEIINVNTTSYDIDTKRVFPANSFDMTLIECYKNGVRLPVKDYYLDQAANKVIFAAQYFNVGDVLAITAIIDYDYIIRSNTLEITNRIPLTPTPNYVRIITFTNQDASFIRTEVYQSNNIGMYKLSREVINDNFVWISVGRRTLTSGYDFRILEDRASVQLDPDIPYVDGEQVIITSFSEVAATRTVGFKMFKDTIGRTHFKRLSAEETTYLIAPLQLTDTEIVVENGAKLPNVLPGSSAPGVIFIAGERIEYLEKNGNVLSNITRATLGTGAKEYYTVGTWVMDHSKAQTMPTTESVIVKTMLTENATVYTIPVATGGIAFTSSAAFHDQVEVYYGGRLLEKPTAVDVVRYRHDSTASYDSGVNDTVLTPDYTITEAAGVYSLNLGFTPAENVEVTIVQRKGKTWYTRQTVSLIDDVSTTANFLKERNAVTVDQLYYGGDPTLRFDDGTKLVLDDGREIKGY